MEIQLNPCEIFSILIFNELSLFALMVDNRVKLVRSYFYEIAC